MSKINALNVDIYPEIFKKYMLEEKKLVSEFVKGKVLDVGCGVGRLIRDLAPKTEKYVGIDVEEEFLDKAREIKFDNVELIKLDAHELEKYFSENFFDRSICLWNSLACIGDEVDVLRQISKVTKGNILLTVSAKGTLKHRICYYEKLGLDYSCDEGTETISSPAWGKTKAYSGEELNEFIEKAGCELIDKGVLADLMHYAIVRKFLQ